MRAAHLPPPHKFPSLFHVLNRPPFLSCSSVTFASFKPPSGCFSTSPPATPYPRPSSRSTYSLPSSSSFPSRWQVRQPRIQDLIPTGKAFCSLVNSGEGDREILVQHLLVSENNSKLILDLQQKISAGVDLSDLAVEYSICPSKKDGGMLGWVKKGQMVPEFEEAAFGAPLNKVVKCKTKFGWHLLQVLSEREGPLLLNIEPEELHSKFQNPGFLEEAQLVDVREPDEVAIASLPGFKVLPLRQFGSWGPGITDELDPQKDTYVLCHHGARSLQVAKWLQTQGFKKVFNVFGGIHAYAVKADSSIPTY